MKIKRNGYLIIFVLILIIILYIFTLFLQNANLSTIVNFDNYNIIIDLISVFTIILSIIFLVISYSLWKNSDANKIVVDVVEFYPPNNLNSLEIGILYKGKADTNAIISLLILLANKGYIKIEEVIDKFLFFEFKTFNIIKLKDYDGKDVNERIIMEGLFEPELISNEKLDIFTLIRLFFEKNIINRSNNVVNSSYLPKYFYKIINKIKVSSNYEIDYEEQKLDKILIILFMIFLIYVTINIPLIAFYNIDIFIILVFLQIIYCLLLLLLKFKKNNKWDNLIHINLGISICLVPWVFLVLPLKSMTLYFVSNILVTIIINLIIVFLKKMPLKIRKNSELLGKIRGFRRFLEIATKDQIEMLVEENPSYYFDILPYTYALGVSNKWIEKFKFLSSSIHDLYGYIDIDLKFFSKVCNKIARKTNDK